MSLTKVTYPMIEGAPINVMNYGADPTGSTDSSAAITDAIEAAIAASPATVYFPSGRYRCDSALGPFTGNDITLDLNTSILDFSNATGTTVGLIEFTGSIASAVTLSSNATSRTKAISCTSTSFSVGDMVLIRSNTVFDSTRTSAKIGELNFVETIPTSASLTTTLELQDTYTTAASAAIQKITPVKRITICNGTIQGPAGNDELIGILITYGNTCLIDNVKSYDIDQKHVRFDQCVYSKVTNCHFQESNHSSQAYGVSFANATQDCSAIGNTFVDVRHSLSTNNTVSSAWGITRRILFSNNNISDSAKATGGSGGDAVDTHAGAEEIYITDNIINSASNNGINFEARTGIIDGNMITNTVDYGIYVNPRADTSSSILVNNNDLNQIGESPNSGYGIRVSLFVTDMANCVVANNRVISLGVPIGLAVDSTQTFINAVVDANIAQQSSSSTVNSAIEIDSARVSVTGNVGYSNSVGCVLTDCSNSLVSGNTFQLFGTSGTNGYGVRLSGTSAYNNINGNTVWYSASGITNTTGVSFASGGIVTYSAAVGNVTHGCTTNVNISTGTGCISANNI